MLLCLLSSFPPLGRQGLHLTPSFVSSLFFILSPQEPQEPHGWWHFSKHNEWMNHKDKRHHTCTTIKSGLIPCFSDQVRQMPYISPLSLSTKLCEAMDNFFWQGSISYEKNWLKCFITHVHKFRLVIFSWIFYVEKEYVKVSILWVYLKPTLSKMKNFIINLSAPSWWYNMSVIPWRKISFSAEMADCPFRTGILL